MANNIFANMNTTVERYSINPGTPFKPSERVLSQNTMKKYEKVLESEDIKHKLNLVKKDEKMSELNGCVITGKIQKTQIMNAINKVTSDAKSALLVNIFEDIFKKSLLLDDDFVAQKESIIHCNVKSYVSNNGGFDLLETAIAHTDSPLLREIKSICEETAKKITTRKIKNLKEISDAEDISFDMTDDEEKEFEYDKTKLSPDEIAELVKKKVFTVIQDEKERQKDEDELIADIEEEISQDDKITDDKSAKEAVNRILTGKIQTEEATLFNAIFRNYYHEYITENLAGAQYTIQHDDERNDAYNELPDMDSEDAANYSPDPVDLNIDKKKEIDMDFVLAEAIASYTLMEMMYTLRIEDYNYQNIRSLTNKLIHPVHETKDESPEREKFVENRKKFFDIFNNIKDLNDVDENKKKMEDYKDSISSDDKSYFDGNVKSAINQIEDIIDKNADRKDDYTPIIDWLKEL